ncbi:Small ubiquitin-related modifier 5 [Raphanus sativus]|uniref:Small ubiquitin-related modifier n=1 Tax=Raphanus sativus TaxID=3726 RepID=A0A6J0MMS2_RAPSA|nr:small ubiquitin-related modifier 5 [Raphanus sativus]XP_056860810.1 small ubiquitin-related modifier 5-like [Raphanus sativus]KAJ4907240.1 Small ubiquitin-related modifier 5 [Raphanus sativus]
MAGSFTHTTSTSSVPKKSPSPESSSQKSPPPPESSSQKKIMIKVKSQQDGGEDLYKIGENAPLKKLMTAYCVKKNLDLSTVRFIFKKKGLKPRHTPSQLKMENNDIIDTVTEQGGGGPYNA